MTAFLGAVAIILAITVFVLLPIYMLFDVIRDIFRYFFDNWLNKNLFFTSVDPLVREYLERSFRYYQNLPPHKKKLFVKRVQKFMKDKSFEGREGLYISPEMEVLIAASAMQLAFGHHDIYFTHFEKIIIYPDVYYSNYTNKYHKGEVNSKGVIVLSWKYFNEGYLNPNDGRNLGLHEMAHALRVVDFVANDEHNFFDRTLFFRFISHAREEMILIENGADSFFRSYAATNDHEFFAVAIENFFERPKEFMEYHPEMYHTIVNLLRQDPSTHQII